jgi:hypothetical protein
MVAALAHHGMAMLDFGRQAVSLPNVGGIVVALMESAT